MTRVRSKLTALLVLLQVGAGAPGLVARSAPAIANEPAPQSRSSLRGLTLVEALSELRSRGLAIVYTSELVLPDMVVTLEPRASDPRRVLDELLAPHGLRVEEHPGGTLVIVAAGSGGPPASRILGEARSRPGLEPLAGVAIRVLGLGVETSSDSEGRFEIPVEQPGTYSLEARREGFLSDRIEQLSVIAGSPAEVTFMLLPLPFVKEEIYVRPSRLSLISEEPSAPLSLGRDEIEAMPQLGGDVFRALSLLPGTTANDLSAQFHVHGGRRDEVLILLDGQELYEAHHLKDFDSALSIVASEGLQGLTLTTGNFSASHGDRMSGVLDMTTLPAARPMRTHLSLSLLNALASTGGAFANERGGWLASGRLGTIDLASRVLGQEDPSYGDLFGKIEQQLDDRQRLSGHLLLSRDSLEFSEVVDGDAQSLDTVYDSSYLWASHDAVLGSRTFVETKGSVSRVDRDRRGAEDEDEQRFVVVDRRDFDVADLEQSWGFQASPRHALKGGFSLRFYDAGYDYSSEAHRDFVLETPGAAPAQSVARFEERFRGEHFGFFAAYRWMPFEPLTVELGLRHDRHPLTDDTLLSPRANLAVRLDENSVLRASWGRFHQSQRPYELQVQDGETRFYPAERSDHWVLGYERLLGHDQGAPFRALRIEAYRRDIGDPRPRYENLFEAFNFFSEVEPDRVRIAPEESTARGIELVLRGSAGTRGEWWMNYAYARIEDTIDGRDVPRQIDQPHALNLNLSQHLGKAWTLSVAWRYHTGWPTTPIFLAAETGDDGEPGLVPTLGPLYSERLKTYHRMDLRLSRHFRTRSGEVTLFVDVQNLYDRKNVAGFDPSVDEESGELQLEVENWPGFFPSLGVAWEF